MNALVSAPIGLQLQTFDDAIRLAKAMSTAGLVPKHLQGDVGSCLLIVEQAMRWRMSPFAVAQCTSNIGGRLMHEGKLIAAAVKSMGAITGHFDFAWSGEGDDRTITVTATRTGDSEPRQVSVRLGDVQTKNEVWKKQPDQQLAYAGARIWARRWTPEALLGVYAPEELSTIDGTATEVPPPPPPVPKPPPPPPPTERSDEQWRVWLSKLRDACAVLRSRKEVTQVGGRESVADAIAHGPAWVARETTAILADNYARWPEDDDLVIPGEENLAAG